MKKQLILLMLAGFFAMHPISAQIGIQGGGVGIFGESFPTADGLDKLGGARGYTFGIFYNKTIGDNLAIQPAVNWLNKQWKDDLDDTEFTKMAVNYLEIPVQAVYTTGGNKGFFIGAGPSFLVGLSGTRTVTINSNTENTGYEFGSDENPEGRLTIGVNAMAGYSFGGLFASVNYGHGLTNQASEEQDFGNKNHLAVRIGFKLGQ